MESILKKQTTPLKPILKESLDRKAANYLRDSVLSGKLAPGQRVTEQILASKLDLSRGTIRSALQRLVSEGLIVQKLYSSWEVMQITADDADDLYTLRSSLEGLAGRLVAGRLDHVARIAIQKAFQELIDAAKSGSDLDVVDADMKFHGKIVELSGSPRLAQHYRLVEGQMRMYMGSVHGVLPNLKAVAEAHTPMVEALLSGNASASESSMVEHCQVYGKKLVDKLRSREDSLSRLQSH